MLPASLMIIFTTCGYFYKDHPAYSILHLQSEVCAFYFVAILINVTKILIVFVVPGGNKYSAFLSLHNNVQQGFLFRFCKSNHRSVEEGKSYVI